jgi:hypothetical protein
MARAARLFGLAALLLAACAPPAEAALRLAAPRSLLQARNQASAAKVVPVFTVPPSAVRWRALRGTPPPASAFPPACADTPAGRRRAC